MSSHVAPLRAVLADRPVVLGLAVVLAGSFWRKGQTLSFAGAWIWFFENWLNIGRYVADARAQVLPLVGGGDHDWHRILTRWGLLEYDTTLAAVLKTVGWVGMIAACGWVAPARFSSSP